MTTEPQTDDLVLTEKERALIVQMRAAIAVPEQMWDSAEADVVDEEQRRKLRTDAYTASIERLRDVTTAVFNHVASEMGVTGWQGSVAALRAYGQIMSINGPFTMIKLEDSLYPQYDTPARLHAWLESQENVQWLADEARKRMQRMDGHLADTVRAHMQRLAGRAPAL